MTNIRKLEAFVKKWLKWYLEVRNVNDLPEKLLARVITLKEDKAILCLFQNIPNLTLRQTQLKRRQKGFNIKYNYNSPTWKRCVISIYFEETIVTRAHVTFYSMQRL